MRIVAGALGGRVFDSPPGNRTHPMSERMRGGLFNALGDIEGLTVLDAFCGSGALSFEALSRGARYVTAVDIDKAATTTAVNSARALGLAGRFKAIRASLISWLETSPNEQRFDIILADPPYDDLQVASIERLISRLAVSGVFILSWPGKEKVPEISGLELVRRKDYGDSQLVFYKRNL